MGEAVPELDVTADLNTEQSVSPSACSSPCEAELR
jgi:hypothetical protein